MADKKLTELDELTTVTSDDLIYVVDDPGASPTSKKVTIDNLKKSIVLTDFLVAQIFT